MHDHVAVTIMNMFGGKGRGNLNLLGLYKVHVKKPQCKQTINLEVNIAIDRHSHKHKRL